MQADGKIVIGGNFQDGSGSPLIWATAMMTLCMIFRSNRVAGSLLSGQHGTVQILTSGWPDIGFR